MKKKAREPKSWLGWFPKVTPRKVTPKGDFVMRPGEPTILSMDRWPNDRALHTADYRACCNCGLEHIYDYAVFRTWGKEGWTYWLQIRPYRVLGTGKKAK